jgi:hypothetical protein
MPRDTSAASDATFERLRRAESAAWLRLISSTVSHALGSGLQVIGGRAALLEASAAPSEEARIIARKVREMTDMLQAVQNYARAGAAPATASPLAPEVEALEELFTPIAKARALALRIEPFEPLSVQARTDDVLVALGALSTVGLKSCTGDGVSWSFVHSDRTPPPSEAGIAVAGAVVALEVRWPGARPQLTALVRPREPWLAPPLGFDNEVACQLALAFGIARENGGWIEWRQADETALSLYLPLAK